mgnify:CR=1 FL=1
MTIGGAIDPSNVERTYDDIEAILHANKKPYKVYEEKTDAGTFKKYIVEA